MTLLTNSIPHLNNKEKAYWLFMVTFLLKFIYLAQDNHSWEMRSTSLVENGAHCEEKSTSKIHGQ